MLNTTHTSSQQAKYQTSLTKTLADSQTKSKVRKWLNSPIRHPEVFERLGIQPQKESAPRTARHRKTLLAKAVAGESEANFVSLNGRK